MLAHEEFAITLGNYLREMQLSGTTAAIIQHLAILLFSLPVLSYEQNSFPAECLTTKDCYCDYKCTESKDCCSSVNGSQPVTASDRSFIQPVCISYENVFNMHSVSPNGLYVSAIAQCPDNKRVSEDIRARCNEADLSLLNDEDKNNLLWLSRNLRTLAPVIGYRDRSVYANVYCAICNGLEKNQVYFSQIKIGCRKDKNEISCLVSAELPRSLARSCLPKGARSFRMRSQFLSMEDIFLIPDEYLNNEYIKLPLVPTDELENETRSGEASVMENVKYGADEAYIWFQIVLLIFSIIGLTLMLIVYGLNSVLRRSLAGLLTMGLGATLLAMEVSFLIVAFGVPGAGNRGFCVFMAAILLFSLLSSFMWMMLMAFQLLLTFGDCKNCFLVIWRYITGQCREIGSAAVYSQGYHTSSSKKRFLKYSPIAIILPLCLVIPAVVVNEKAFNQLALVYAYLSTPSPSGTLDEADMKAIESVQIQNITRVEVLGSHLSIADPGFCPDSARAWFTNFSGLLVWFLVPAGTMIIFNFIALIVVCIQICRLSKESQIHSSPQNEQEKKRRKNSKNLAGICGKLAIILGVTWFVQFFAGWLPHLLVMRRILALVNCAQGGVIALSMLISVKARRALASMLPESWRGYFAPVSTTHSKDRETSSTSKTWTSVLLPKRTRPQPKTDKESNE
ncbi:unnamed protein product [Hymenolepis diminuta]|uniref:G-protein coupled receptors family 2 profile 2 domain-containing protein n=1 Tax=Hymenolepis diminuta TaxID=6216 RepID=A0A564YH66_HYMDI|nr:unnamed protein product [Hymenolepis diminuta]